MGERAEWLSGSNKNPWAVGFLSHQRQLKDTCLTILQSRLREEGFTRCKE